MAPLMTRTGAIPLPAYIPVTTFGPKYPLDALIRPYLPRLAPAVMIAYHFARQMAPEERPDLPLLIDSGGFASLFTGARIQLEGGLGVLETLVADRPERLHPSEVLDLQERLGADIAFTLDFPVPPRITDPDERELRLTATVANALWALRNRRRRDMLLFASVQAWDVDSARRCVRAYAAQGFDGLAIGGLVPRVADMDLVETIIRTVRTEMGPDLPLHVFGLGHPALVARVFAAGATSVDSSAYVRLAAAGRLWSDPDYRAVDPSPFDRLRLALENLWTATATTQPLRPRHDVIRANRSGAYVYDPSALVKDLEDPASRTEET